MPLMGRRRLAPKCTMLPQKHGRLERVNNGYISAVDQRYIPVILFDRCLEHFSSLDLFALKDVFVGWVCVCLSILMSFYLRYL